MKWYDCFEKHFSCAQINWFYSHLYMILRFCWNSAGFTTTASDFLAYFSSAPYLHKKNIWILLKMLPSQILQKTVDFLIILIICFWFIYLALKLALCVSTLLPQARSLESVSKSKLSKRIKSSCINISDQFQYNNALTALLRALCRFSHVVLFT